MIYFTSVDQFALLPAMMLALFGCATLLFDFWVFPEPKQRKWLLPVRGRSGWPSRAAALIKQQICLAAHGPFTAFQGSLIIDGLVAVLQLDLPGGVADRGARLLQVPGDRTTSRTANTTA